MLLSPAAMHMAVLMQALLKLHAAASACQACKLEGRSAGACLH